MVYKPIYVDPCPCFQINATLPPAPLIKMSTHTSKACCERPAAVPENYTPQGTYQTIGNTKCYITGPKDARKAIYFIYDIFGLTNPSLQGADILASKGKEPYLVIMPDLFDGQPVQPEWIADREANKEKISAFMSKLQDPEPHIKRVLDILAAAKEEFTGVQSWGTIGCTFVSLPPHNVVLIESQIVGAANSHR